MQLSGEVPVPEDGTATWDCGHLYRSFRLSFRSDQSITKSTIHPELSNHKWTALSTDVNTPKKTLWNVIAQTSCRGDLGHIWSHYLSECVPGHPEAPPHPIPEQQEEASKKPVPRVELDFSAHERSHLISILFSYHLRLTIELQ